MNRDQLLKAKPGIVALIREQGETRLQNQCAFMDAQDGRGGALLTAATSLAAAATAVASGASAIDGATQPLVWAAAAATLGFSLSAGLALWSLRSVGFHAVGWFPDDFEPDLTSGATVADVEADFVVSLQERLTHNAKVLDRRGAYQNLAGYALFATPILAGVVAAVSAYLAL